MFSNSGGKTKVLAWITFILGVVGSVSGAILFFAMGAEWWIAVLIIGLIMSWVSALPLYALGEAVVLAESAEFEAFEANRILARNNETLNEIKRLLVKK